MEKIQRISIIEGKDSSVMMDPFIINCNMTQLRPEQIKGSKIENGKAQKGSEIDRLVGCLCMLLFRS